MKRILSAVVFIPLFYFLTSHPSPLPFVVFVCLCAAVASWEFSRLVKSKGVVTHTVPNAICTVLLCSAVAFPSLDVQMVFALILLVITALCLATCRETGRYLESVALSILGCVFLGLLMGYQCAIRMTEGSVPGHLLIFFLYLVIWAGDSGALYVGRSLGRTPLAPRLSPNKTVEGAVGGMIMSLLAAVVARYWFIPQVPLVQILAVTAVINVLGQFGDLVESGFKRSAGVKDSASFIPGHGGLLDRADSLLFAGPALYYFAVLFLAM